MKKTSQAILPEEMDLRDLLRVLRRSAPAILAATLLVGGGAYSWAARQPAMYSASASLMTGNNTYANALVADTLAAPPVLPPGALEQAIRSQKVVSDVIARLKRSSLPDSYVRKIASDLEAELTEGQFKRFSVRAPVESENGGVYEIRGLAETPDAARILTSFGVAAVLAWDQARARQDVIRAQNILQQQYDAVSAQVAATPRNSPELERLRQSQAEVRQALTHMISLRSSVGDSLSIVSAPVTPRDPVEPNPPRSGLIAAVLAALLTGSLALLRHLTRPLIYSPHDLQGLGPPVLAQLPSLKFRRGRPVNIIQAGRTGGWSKGISFLGLNLLAAANHRSPARIVVSGISGGEGASSVTAALADSLGKRGYRVLVLETEWQQPSQLAIFSPTGESRPAQADGGASPAEAQAQDAVPETPNGRVVHLSPNVDLLSAEQVASALQQRRQTEGGTVNLSFQALMTHWSHHYDVLLIDAPPLGRVPDGAALAARCDGVMLVVQSGQTAFEAVSDVVQNAALAHAPVLGFVINHAAVPRLATVPSVTSALPGGGLPHAEAVAGAYEGPGRTSVALPSRLDTLKRE